MASLTSDPSAVQTVDTTAAPSRLIPSGDAARAVPVRVRQFIRNADRRRVVFDPAGSDEAVVVTESSRAPDRGTLTVRAESSAGLVELRGLLAGTERLLLSLSPPVGEEAGENVWLQAAGEVAEQHHADGVLLADRWLTVQWVQVAPQT